METSNVLPDKWFSKDNIVMVCLPSDNHNGSDTWHVLECFTPLANSKRKYNKQEAKDNAKLVATAVNACKAINPNNPIKVAEVLPDIFKEVKNFIDNAIIDKKIAENQLIYFRKRLSDVLKQATE